MIWTNISGRKRDGCIARFIHSSRLGWLLTRTCPLFMISGTGTVLKIVNHSEIIECGGVEKEEKLRRD